MKFESVGPALASAICAACSLAHHYDCLGGNPQTPPEIDRWKDCENAKKMSILPGSLQKDEMKPHLKMEILEMSSCAKFLPKRIDDHHVREVSNCHVKSPCLKCFKI